MWYLNLIQALIIPKIPQQDQNTVGFFLIKFFEDFHKEIFFNEPTIPINILFGIITKLDAKYENTTEFSLAEFCRYTFSLALVYAKVTNDTVSWNSDFIYLFENILDFLELEEEINELTEYFERPENISFTKKGKTSREKAINCQINELEKEILQDLNYKLTIDLSKMETIFFRFASHLDLYSFYSQTEGLLGDPSIFAVLMLHAVVRKIEVFCHSWLYLELPEGFLKIIAETKLKWEDIKKEIVKSERNEVLIAQKKDKLIPYLLEAIQFLLLPEESLEIIRTALCSQIEKLCGEGPTNFEIFNLDVLFEQMNTFIKISPKTKTMDSFFETVLQARTVWNIAKEQVIPAADEATFKQTKNIIKSSLLIVLESMDSIDCRNISLQTIFIFYTEFSKNLSFLTPILEKISEKLSFSNTEPLVVGLQELTHFADSLALPQQQIFLEYIRKFKHQLNTAVVQNSKEIKRVKTQIQEQLLKETKITLLQKTSLDIMRIFCNGITTSLFACLKDQISSLLDRIDQHPLLKEGLSQLDSTCALLRATGTQQNGKIINQFAEQAKKMAEALLYAVQKQDAHQAMQIKIQFRKLLDSLNPNLCAGNAYEEMWTKMLVRLSKFFATVKVDNNFYFQFFTIESNNSEEDPANLWGNSPQLSPF